MGPWESTNIVENSFKTNWIHARFWGVALFLNFPKRRRHAPQGNNAYKTDMVQKMWSQLGTNSVPNGFPMHPHGLILGEDGATARADLLDTLPAGFRGGLGGLGG